MSAAVAGRLLALALGVAAGCAGPVDPWSYRLAEDGEPRDRQGQDAVLEAVRPRYPAFFAVVLDPGSAREPDLRPLRRDLERTPVDRRSYDALNAVAIGYFELEARAASTPGGPTYFADSFRAAQLLALPWRAYGKVEDARLRGAILDFFEDAGTGERRAGARTAPRLAALVASLEAKEEDESRRERIRRLALRLAERARGGREDGPGDPPREEQGRAR